MANAPAPGPFVRRKKFTRAGLALIAAATLLILPARPGVAQDSPHVTAVDPQSGKVNDTITVTGAGLEKTRVSAVFLSDDKDDHKAAVVSQDADKIVMKVPAVKPGDYNISIQSGNSILIQPVRFTVE